MTYVPESANRSDWPRLVAQAIRKLQTTTPTGVSTPGSGSFTLTSGNVTTALGYTPVNPSSLAAVATSGSAADLSAGTLLAARMPALTGDVTTTAGTVSTTIANGAVTLAKMANLATNSIIGNNTASAATPIALTATQVKSLLAISASDVSGLATVATTGTYSSLTGTPTNVSTFTNDANYITGVAVANDTTNASTVYPLWRTGTSSGVTSVNISSTKLSFIPSTGILTATGFSGGGSALNSLDASNVSAGTLAIARGGTGTGSTPANGQLLIGNGTGYTLATLTAGTNVTITNSAGGVSIAASGGGSSTILNDNATTGPVYPVFYTGTGTTSTFYQSNGGLLYYPSTGALKTTLHRTPAASTADTSAVSAETVMAARLLANRAVPTIRDSGFSRSFQIGSHPRDRNYRQWRFGAGTSTATNVATLGAFSFNTASGVAPTVVTPTVAAPFARGTISTSTATGNVAYTRANTTGIGAVVMGTAFHASFCFGNVSPTSSASRTFVGLVDVVTAPTNIDPTTATAPGCLGIGNAAAANPWVILSNVSGTARSFTILTSPYTSVATNLYYMFDIWSNGTNVYWQISTYDTTTPANGFNNSIVTGTFPANVPASGTLLYPVMWITNNTSAAAVTMECISVTLETEY